MAKKDFRGTINPAEMFIRSSAPEEREVAPAPEGYKVNPLYIETKSERLQLLVTPSLKKALKEKAKSQSRSVNDLINSILEDTVKGE